MEVELSELGYVFLGKIYRGIKDIREEKERECYTTRTYENPYLNI